MAKRSKVKLFDRERPPRMIELCGQKIRVRLVEHLEDSGQDLLGAWNGETKTIYLLKGHPWKGTLYHEMCHAIWTLTAASEGLTQTKEEQLVLALENFMTDFL